jgi:hypothetical protein
LLGSLRLPALVGLGAFVVGARAGEARAADDVAPAVVSTNPNRPPKILRWDVWPHQPEIQIIAGGPAIGPVVAVGQTARITLSAEDPEGDGLAYRVHALPQGATFDEREGVLTWKPSNDQIGKRRVTFEVTDGRSVVTKTIVFVVRANLAPIEYGGGPDVFVVGKKRSSNGEDSRVLAQDSDSEALSVVVEKRPPGLRVNLMEHRLGYEWEPTEADVGEHELVVVVSDGERKTRFERALVVIPEWAESDYRGWFLFGGGASGFVAHDDGEAFVGGAVNITLVALAENWRDGYACAHETKKSGCHASHHRFYGEFEVLDSLDAGAPSLFVYAAGYSASFEWYPARRSFIPHYGIEVGGLVRDGLGHRAQTRPYLGLHLYADRQLWIDAAIGYRIVPAELSGFSGPTATLRAVVNPW